jgi:hypothetical protein
VQVKTCGRSLLRAGAMAAALGVGAEARGQGPVEATVAFGWAAPQVDGTYAHAFVPRVAFDPTSGGQAGHTLTLDGASGLTFSGALRLRISSRLGVQAVLATGRHDRGGPSGPYAIRLSYTAPQPPSNLPQRFTLERSDAWPEATGRLRHLVLGVSASVRAVDTRSWTLDLAAGPTLHRVSGTLDGLAFSDFRLGGHGVLFSDTYRLGADLEPQWVAGLNLGAAAGLRVSDRVRLVVDARLFRARHAQLQPTVARILNPDEVIVSLTPQEIAARMTLAPLELRPSFTSVSAGVRLGL